MKKCDENKKEATVDGRNCSVCESKLEEFVASLHRERAMFGCTAEAIDEALDGKSARDVALYAIGTLSNAQELIRRCDDGWAVTDRDADTIRRLINVAKYAMDKAVPR
jgi:hypothetical protein